MNQSPPTAATRGPRASVNELCLPRTTFLEDLRLAAQIGYSGISIDTMKLSADGDDHQILEEFAKSGLEAAVCCNHVWSILPIPNFPEPSSAAERIEGICAGIRRLAPFSPDSVFCVLGQPGEYTEGHAWRIVDDGLRRIHDVASENGVNLSVEVMIREGGRKIEHPMVSSIEETLDHLDHLGLDDVSIVADVWHLHDSDGFLDSLRDNATRISALQMDDYHPPRAWRDRLMPGDGNGNVAEAITALREGGFNGWLDLEVFSDDLWRQTPEQFMAQGLDAIRHCWDLSLGADA